MTIKRQKLFLRMMTSLFQAQQSVADLFFKNRLDEDISQALEKHIQYLARPSKETQHEYIRSLKDLDKILQEITYLEKGDAIQLALSHEQALRYLHDFLREIRTIKQTPTGTEAVTKSIAPASRPLTSSAPVIQKSRRNKNKLSETQEKILEFVRREPDCRTKDVVSQFSALSQRTVKRGLKELSEEGKIVKRADGVAVYYSVA
jgi:DNA-binding transcriptional ArsR family regulator